MLDSNTEKAFALWMLAGYIFFNVQMPFGIILTSGTSMEPTLEGCEVAVLDTNPSVEEGDVIAFYNSENGKQVLHRAVMETSEGWVTQGDNVDHFDLGAANESEVYGELVWHSPSLC